MHTILPHRAVLQLMRFQRTARATRAWNRFCVPRRLVLSILALVLTVVWLGQLAASVLMRQPADPDKLAAWIPLGLLAYTLWHLLRAAGRPPVEPFEWTPAECELLQGAPLRRYDLVMYRLLTIAMATAAKAACFTLVMLPDLRVWPAGFAGIFLALLLVDLVRMMIEIVVYGMTRREFIIFRIGTFTAAGFVLGVAVWSSLPLVIGHQHSALPPTLDAGMQILNELIALRHTLPGMIAEAPFDLYARLILMPHWSWPAAGQLVLAQGLVVAAAAAALWLDRQSLRRRAIAERAVFRQRRADDIPRSAPRRASSPIRYIPPRMRGAGTLAWRQALGAFHYRTSLGMAMVVPAFLSCLTLLTPQRGTFMLIQLVAGLAFYSFLLLPTAFKFDFRRDVARLAVLKALPISPTAVTWGQLAVPVLLCTLFQLAVLLIALAIRPYPLSLLPAAIAVLVPTNILIFSLENLIFLLYPYRLGQEGLGVFFRSILTFTAKGLLFAAGLAVTLAWAWASRFAMNRPLVSHLSWAGPLAFVSGLWLIVTLTALGITAVLTGVYRRFDPSQDTPSG